MNFKINKIFMILTGIFILVLPGKVLAQKQNKMNQPNQQLFMNSNVLRGNTKNPVNKENYIKGQFIIKFKSTGAYALEEDCEYLLDNEIPFNNSLDALNKKFKIKKAKGLFQNRHGLTTTEARKNHERRFSKIKKQFSKRVKASQNKKLMDLTNVYVFTMPEDMSIEECIKEYSKDPHVEYIQPNYQIKIQLLPNDPFYSSIGSWGQAYDDLWGLKTDKMNMEPSWDITQGEGVIVAVVDSGLDYNHEDILGNVWANTNDPIGDIADNCDRVADPLIALADDDCNGYIDDVRGWDFVNNDNDPMDGHGHGTHVSGTIAAVGNNGIGITGVAPRAKIMPLKGLSDSGAGSSDGLAAAIVYAANNGASIINNSWGCLGGCPSNPVAEDAVRYANGLGVVVVFAAGNDNNNVSQYSPQKMAEVITVGASNENDGKASFSNWGDLIDVSAPGGGTSSFTSIFEESRNILSLKSSLAGDSMTGNGQLVVAQNYVRQAGTSMACPNVAGVTALLVNQFPNDSVDEIKLRLMATVDLYPVNIPQGLGTGRVNAYKALTSQPKPLIQVDATFETEVAGNGNGIPESGETISLNVVLRNLWKTASSVTAVLSTNNLDVSILNAVYDYGTIASGEIKNSSVNPFLFEIGNIDFDTSVMFTLDLTIDGEVISVNLPVTLGIKRLTTMPKHTNDLKIDNNYVVYGSGGQVYLYNIMTDQTQNLSQYLNDPLAGGFAPGIYQNLIVWNQFYRPRSGSDILLYDTNTGITTNLLESSTNKEPVRIYGNIITWSEFRYGNWDVFMYDLLTGVETQITSDSGRQLVQSFDGEFIVWLDDRNSLQSGEFDIYTLNVQSGQETRVTTVPLYRDRVQGSNGKIVFHQFDYRYGNADIYLIDLNTLEEKIISDGASVQSFPSIWNDRIVWNDNRFGEYDIFMYDLNLDEETRITKNVNSWQVVPNIWQNKIVWIDQRNSVNDIYMTEFDDALLQPAKLKSPKPGTSLTSSTVTFTWALNDSEEVFVGFHVATDPYGFSKIYSNSTQTGTSVTITDSAFMSGDPVYVSLYSRVAGQIASQEYTFQTGGVFQSAEMLDPMPGSLIVPTAYGNQIPTADVTFNWDAGIGVTQYWLRLIGDTFGRAYENLTSTSVMAPNIPLDGKPFIVQLWSEINGEWVKNEYVYETNQAPVLNPIGNKSVVEGTPLSIMATATDINGPGIVWSINVLPDTLNYTFDTTSTLLGVNFLEISDTNPSGTWDVTVRIEDPEGLSDEETFTVDISSGIIFPPIVIIPGVPPEIDPIGLKIGVEGNILEFPMTGVDLNGGTLILFAQLSNGATLSTIGATFTDNGDGTGLFSWTPAVGQSGSYDFTFTAASNIGGGGSTDESVTIIVNAQSGTPLPPEIMPIADRTVDEGALLSFIALANDPNGDTISLSAQLSNGDDLSTIGATFTDSGDGTGAFFWTPFYNLEGNHQVVFSAFDGISTTTETMTITVNNIVIPPPTVSISVSEATLTVGVPFQLTISGTSQYGLASVWWFLETDNPSGVLGSVDGVNGYLNTAQGFGSGKGLKTYSVTHTVVIYEPGDYVIKANSRDLLYGKVLYEPHQASEGLGIPAIPVNVAPEIIQPSSQTIVIGESLSFSVNAQDADGDTLTLEVLNSTMTDASFSASLTERLPDGTSTIEGQFIWTPSKSQAEGVYTVQFRVLDNRGGEVTSSLVEITVEQPNTPPRLRYVRNIANRWMVWRGHDKEDGRNINYSYRIDNGTWSPSSIQRWLAIQSLELSKGRHIFEIKAIDSKGSESNIRKRRIHIR